jgi:hypothetical protein
LSKPQHLNCPNPLTLGAWSPIARSFSGPRFATVDQLNSNRSVISKMTQTARRKIDATADWRSLGRLAQRYQGTASGAG